ncbi:MAG: hypothetical protein ABIR57_11485 [Aeromicrobium sp.]
MDLESKYRRATIFGLIFIVAGIGVTIAGEPGYGWIPIVVGLGFAASNGWHWYDARRHIE